MSADGATSPINVGIIGLGFMAATHIRAYRQIEGVRIVALCNPSGRNLNGDLSQATGNIDTGAPLRLNMEETRAYRDVDAFFADDEVTLVDICSPTSSHMTLSLRALAVGRHVICEKPLARTVEAAQRIVDAARKARGYCMPAMCLRFWPEWRWLKQAVAEKTYGKVLSARFRRVAEPPAWGQANFLHGAESGGALFDLHIHDTDFVNYCFGVPRRVFSTGYSNLSGAVDHVVTQYDVACGASVHAEGGWSMAPGFGFSMAYTVNFEHATADYDVGRGAESLRLFVKGKQPETVRCEGPDGYVGELRHMVECIRAQRPPSVVTVEDGLASVTVCAAEERSVAEGVPVALV